MEIAHKVRMNKDDIVSFCKRNGIKKLSIFGSVLRDDFRPDSDIDLLVEFEDGRKVSYFDIFDMEDALSEIFGGRKVDIRTPSDLSRYFREDVMRKAVVQYAS